MGNKKKNGFLQDDNGDNSMIRLMSLISIVMACIITIIPTIKGTSVDSLSLFSWLGFAFFPKVMQKVIENKFLKGENTNE